MIEDIITPLKKFSDDRENDVIFIIELVQNIFAKIVLAIFSNILNPINVTKDRNTFLELNK